MSTADEPRNGFAYRMASVEEQLRRLFSYEPAVQKQRIDQHDKDINDLDHRIDGVVDEIRSLRKALYTLALAIAGTGAAAIITAIQIAGG